MANKSRGKRMEVKKIESVEILPDTYYCRKCKENKIAKYFYTATDLFLDSSGYMSICKSCINEIYNGICQNEKSMERTLLRMCRMLNVKYDEAAVRAAQAHINTLSERGTKTENIFGIYKNKLISVKKTRISEKGRNDGYDLVFEEPSSDVLKSLPEEEISDVEYYEKSWGKGNNLSSEDYEFLEEEFSKWRKTTKCDTQAEEVLVRELCHKQNEIRKARVEGRSVDGLVKSLQEIMKNSALTPALQNAASSGKSAETFGMWIKDIEQKTPAEWFEDKKKFHDIDGMEEDKKDILRSIANFITGSRDFNSTEIEEISDYDLEEE